MENTTTNDTKVDIDKLNVDEVEYDNLDVTFVIDATGSMGTYINEAKESIKEIISKCETDLKEAFPDTYNEKLKFSIVAYRDHPPQDNSFVTDILDFCTSEKAITYLNKLSASGGGDAPEAALDGLNAGINKVSWRDNSDKMLFLVLDAPPHGKRFDTSYECPCGLHEKDFLPEMVRKKIKFFIIRAPNNPGLDKMINLFEKYTPIDIKQFSGNIKNQTRTYIPLESKSIEGLHDFCDFDKKEVKTKSAMNDYISYNVEKTVKTQIKKSKMMK